MKGYYGMDRETAEAFSGGWFHTGDIGSVDSDGFLRITDRKKDIIVASSGKNIAPQAIENRLKLIPYFENSIVVGDGRNFISALIVPNYDALARLAQSHKIAFQNPLELARNRRIYDLAMAEIDRLTPDLAPFEKIRKIAFVGQEFTSRRRRVDTHVKNPTLCRRKEVQVADRSALRVVKKRASLC